jgi:D-glycero-alpha-D-manno-heptose-7-phosphate kinase
MPTKERLAREAIHIEQDMIGENVGCQDQTLAAFGGFNYIEFGGEDVLSVRRVTIDPEKLRRLADHMMMFFTGFSRTASEIAKHQIDNIPKKQPELKRMYEMTQEALQILEGDDLRPFGKLLDESWRLKRSLSDKITTAHIDEIYDGAMRAGALGGKLLGAGGGGFVLIFAEPDRQDAVRKALNGLLEIPFKCEGKGSQIIFFEPDSGVVH